MKRSIKWTLAVLGTVFVSASPAYATSSCDARVTRVNLAGDNSFSIYFDVAPPVGIGATPASHDSILSIAMTSLSAGRGVTVLYGTNGVPCTNNSGVRGDFVEIDLR